MVTTPKSLWIRAYISSLSQKTWSPWRHLSYISRDWRFCKLQHKIIFPLYSWQRKWQLGIPFSSINACNCKWHIVFTYFISQIILRGWGSQRSALLPNRWSGNIGGQPKYPPHKRCKTYEFSNFLQCVSYQIKYIFE